MPLALWWYGELNIKVIPLAWWWNDELNVKVTPLSSRFFLNILLTNWLPKLAVSAECRPYSANKLIKRLEMVDAEVLFRV